MELNSDDKKWAEFILKNRKWDSSKRKWLYPKNNQYHMKVKNIWVPSQRGFFNNEKKEKGFWQSLPDGYEMGPQLYAQCQLCGIKLDDIRSATYPCLSRQVQKFCCKSHMIEYSKRKKIRTERFGKNNSVLSWPTRQGERVFRSEIKVSKVKKTSLKEFALKSNKSKFDSR